MVSWRPGAEAACLVAEERERDLSSELDAQAEEVRQARAAKSGAESQCRDLQMQLDHLKGNHLALEGQHKQAAEQVCLFSLRSAAMVGQL